MCLVKIGIFEFCKQIDSRCNTYSELMITFVDYGTYR
jgi:hypothetical protein